MITLIVTIIFIISALGVVFILVRKMPALAEMPRNGDTGLRDYHLILQIETKIKNIYAIFQKQIFLHRFLSWVKVMTLKAETKIDTLLHRIRRKAQEIDKKNNGKNGQNLLL
jgi:hypothetical protein